MEIPVACTLGPAAVGPRIEQWRAVLSRAVTRVERVAPDRLACELDADLADLRALAVLAQAEKACCRFFTFAFEVEVDAVTMMVGVPDDATSTLDQFAALAGTGSHRRRSPSAGGTDEPTSGPRDRADTLVPGDTGR